jgi:hypothetical protein
LSDRFIFVSVPHIETLYPPAAYGALRPVIKKAGLNIELNDINLYLKEIAPALNFDEITDWSMYAKNTLSAESDQWLEKAFNDTIDLRGQGWIGISVFSFVVTRAVERLLRWLKNKKHEYKILLGGNGCMSVLADYSEKEFGVWCLDNNLCNYVIFGEGEISLKNLLAGNTDFPGINNINFKQIRNLDELDYPDYSGINWHRYHDPRILITGSRGCVRNCTFCDIALSWPKFSYRSAEKLVDEIRMMVHEHGMTKFEFTDSLINGSVSNFNRFNELLIDAKAKDPALKSVSYMGQFICRNEKHMPEITYELMHYAGCKQITVGIESFSERVRYHMKKKFSDSDIDYHLKQCARWSIPNVLLMIVGYPTETLNDHQSNVRAMHKYKIYSDMGTIFMIRWGFTMNIFEGSPISSMKNDLGLIEVEQGNADSVFNWISTKNPELDLRERIRRRLELHHHGVELGYAMPNSKKELVTLLELARDYAAPRLIKAANLC